MEKKQAEELLNALLNGEITAQEFKARAKGPTYVFCFFYEASGPDGAIMPDDMVTLFIDGIRKELPFSECSALPEKYPYTEFIPASFFGLAPAFTREGSI